MLRPRCHPPVVLDVSCCSGLDFETKRWPRDEGEESAEEREKLGSGTTDEKKQGQYVVVVSFERELFDLCR